MVRGKPLTLAELTRIGKVWRGNPTFGGDRLAGLLPRSISRSSLFETVRNPKLGLTPEEIRGYTQAGKVQAKTGREPENIEKARTIAQEKNRTTGRSARSIAKELKVSRTTARRIIKKNLKLKCFKKAKTAQNAEKTGYAHNALLLGCARPHFSDVRLFSDVETRRNRGDRSIALGAYIENPADAKADSGSITSAIRGWILAALWTRKSPTQKPDGSHLPPLSL